MTQETALGAALKSAVQTMSKKKQTDMIAEHIYNKYDVFKRFKPLAVGIDQDLIVALPQYDPTLIARVLANHCRRPRYLKALARGGKRFDLNNRFKGEVSTEEQAIAQQHPLVQGNKPQEAGAQALPTEANSPADTVTTGSQAPVAHHDAETTATSTAAENTPQEPIQEPPEPTA